MVRSRPLPRPLRHELLTSSPISGQPVSHAFAKEMIAGFAGAEVDRFAEGTGENWVDKERSKHEAKKQAEQMYDDHYGQNDQYDPNSQQPPQQMQQYGNGNW